MILALQIRDIDFGWRRTRLWPNAPPIHARQLVSAPRVPVAIAIMVDRFERDRTKAAANYKKHGVCFEDVVLCF